MYIYNTYRLGEIADCTRYRIDMARGGSSPSIRVKNIYNFIKCVCSFNLEHCTSYHDAVQ